MPAAAGLPIRITPATTGRETLFTETDSVEATRLVTGSLAVVEAGSSRFGKKDGLKQRRESLFQVGPSNSEGQRKSELRLGVELNRSFVVSSWSLSLESGAGSNFARFGTHDGKNDRSMYSDNSRQGSRTRRRKTCRAFL